METHSEIKAIILFGSHARGDADHDSDIDVCVLVRDRVAPTAKEVRALAPSLPKGGVTVSTYCEQALAAMLEYGSLFLWHLRLEGRVLYGKDYVTLQLDRLKPFKRHNAEIAHYRELLRDLIQASKASPYPNEFDLSLLFTLARNTCMILAHKAGAPVFGRFGCYDTAARRYPRIPLDRETYTVLSRWKSAYERALRVNSELPCDGEMTLLIGRIQNLLEFANEATR